MKKYILLIAGISLMGLSSLAHAASDPIMCTADYSPVCGSVQVQCIQAPCEPVRQTFSNACMANAAHATDIQTGECAPTIPPVIGWQRDAHGCLTGAGYSWSTLAGQCIRPWESHVRTVTIAPDNDTCTDRDPTHCLKGKFGFSRGWFNFYGGISGFSYVPGYRSKLQILETRHTPVDISYSLIREITRTQVTPTPPPTTDPNLIGDWRFQSYFLDDMGFVVPNPPTLTLTRDSYHVRFCNVMNGAYTTSGGVLSSPIAISTKMACADSMLNTIENAWNPDGARYAITSPRLTPGSTGSTLILTITLKKWGVFTFVR
jgi:heat shock protein HslJ